MGGPRVQHDGAGLGDRQGAAGERAVDPVEVRRREVGAVGDRSVGERGRSGLAGEAAVRAVYRDFVRSVGPKLMGAVVQPMAAPGVELLAGVAQDRVFGPLVLLGAGGTAAEVLADRTVRLAPLTERDLSRMVTELRSAPLLTGRGATPAVDLDAVRSVLARLSRLATDVPELVETDLNPVIARPDGAVCVDARVRLEPRPVHDPCLRRLRCPPAAGDTGTR
ncbi:acetate--CoA ligase family protein [Streptomyces sp. XY431]|uniref:acetate--CoA ligase family protein n=1 Tax=Streptomyces sp. XY431 TaxID=1415562 RepID=UPI002572DE40|nr:acetate--CoA ligase family protein [Streptomyces sp. XY431]